jgi:hypothetical protein
MLVEFSAFAFEAWPAPVGELAATSANTMMKRIASRTPLLKGSFIIGLSCCVKLKYDQ